MNNLVMQGAEPFFFPGGPTGCLLIHGFTGTPREMRWMGEYLSKKGFTVLGVRLAGHATSPEDMRRSSWRDWVASIEDGITLLQWCSPQPIHYRSVHGWCAQLDRGQAAIRSMGRLPYQPLMTCPQDWRLPFIKPLSVIIRNVGKGIPDWQNPEAAMDHAEYPYYPSASILQLRHCWPRCAPICLVSNPGPDGPL